jgi:hypothetical protein
MKIYTFLLLAMASAHAMENPHQDTTQSQKIAKATPTLIADSFDLGTKAATLIALVAVGGPTLFNAVRHPIRSFNNLVEYATAHPYSFTTKAALYTFLTTMGLSQSARESVSEYVKNKLNLDENWNRQS